MGAIPQRSLLTYNDKFKLVSNMEGKKIKEIQIQIVASSIKIEQDAVMKANTIAIGDYFSL